MKYKATKNNTDNRSSLCTPEVNTVSWHVSEVDPRERRDEEQSRTFR